MLDWQNICLPKKDGWLGIQSSSQVNDAYMMKLACKLCCEKDKLWVKVVRGKYNMGGNILPDRNFPPNASRCCLSIAHVWTSLMNSVRWRLGDGLSVKF